MASSLVRAGDYIALRMSSGYHKLVKIAPDTSISLGKYGSFATNIIIGRPFWLTYELLDTTKDEVSRKLRIVPASQLHAEALSEDVQASTDINEDVDTPGAENEALEVITEDGKVLIRNNRLTIDDSSRQALTSAEIDELRRADTGSGREIIEKIMKSHSALDEKTSYSLAKYTLRKAKKYLRRFTVLPVDVSNLMAWMLVEKDAPRIMELREETLGLINSWANVHSHGADPTVPGGRHLVVDETGGLIIASMAEKMNMLYKESGETLGTEGDLRQDGANEENASKRVHRDWDSLEPAGSGSITVVHSATQANLSMLEYFGYDQTNPDVEHPLYTRLHSLSLLQLLEPTASAIYAQEPEAMTEEELQKLKANKRGNYYRKRRRWARTRKIVDETREGGFDSLIIATHMALPELFHVLVPLVRGGGQVVAYSPYSEPLAELCDTYSSARKTAFISACNLEGEDRAVAPSKDFPVDPRLLLAPTLQTVRARKSQVLPGRTHPLMTSRGGPEGYVFTATKVIPVEGKVEARGNFVKRRAAVAEPQTEASPNGNGAEKRKVETTEDMEIREATRMRT